MLSVIILTHTINGKRKEMFRDFFCIWDEAYPDHPLPRRANKTASNNNVIK